MCNIQTNTLMDSNSTLLLLWTTVIIIPSPILIVVLLLTSNSRRMPLCPQVSRSSNAWDQKFSSWSGSVPSCATVNLNKEIRGHSIRTVTRLDNSHSQRVGEGHLMLVNVLKRHRVCIKAGVRDHHVRVFAWNQKGETGVSRVLESKSVGYLLSVIRPLGRLHALQTETYCYCVK